MHTNMMAFSTSTVRQVFITPGAYLGCVTHAFSTEVEEVMGLLIGKIENGVCTVHGLVVLQRMDKRKDRVEIAPEQLSNGVLEAEDLSHKLGHEVNVVGWYHSHPHITVFPSDVDVRTQLQYQLFSSDWIGLIFGVFDLDKQSMAAQVNVICFQSVENEFGRPEHVILPVHVIPSLSPDVQVSISGDSLDNLLKVPQIFFEEEEATFQRVDATTQGHTLTQMHNCSVYIKNCCKMLELCSAPLLEMLRNRNQDLKCRMAASSDQS